MVNSEDAVFCPYCSRSLGKFRFRVSDFLTCAAIFSLFSACMLSFTELISVGDFPFAVFSGQLGWIPGSFPWFDLIQVVSGVLLFVFGIAGAIMMLIKRSYWLAFAGVLITLVSWLVFIVTLGLFTIGGSGFSFISILTILNVFFLALSLGWVVLFRREFS